MNATRTFLEAIVTAGRYGLQLTKADEADTIKRDAFEAGLIKLSRTKRATLTTSGLEYLSTSEPETAIGAEAFQFQPIVPSETAHCENCGSTDPEDLTTGDDGYSACCNEPVVIGTFVDNVKVAESRRIRAAVKESFEKTPLDGRKPAKKPAAKKPATDDLRGECDGCGKARELFHHEPTGLAVCTACDQRYAKTESFQPRVTSSHADCDHPSTKSARAICRRERAKLAAEAAAAKPASRKAKAAS